MLALTLALLALPPQVPVEQYTLPNGLTVVLSPDNRAPVVAVEIRYRVGSAHEPKGLRGFAHLFEHLMFQGSPSWDDEYFKVFHPLGGDVNGTTSNDRTNYYEQVPANYLEHALWMESDRMRGLTFSQDKLDNQRDVVLNERRQNYEDRPYGMIWAHMAEMLYPEGHPYHHTAIGEPEDLKAANLDDVKAFYAKYYTPSNAIITLVGDFDVNEAKMQIMRYFGDIPAGEAIPAPSPSPFTPKGGHLVTYDKVKLPKITLVWHTPALYAPGDAEMDILSSVLAEGKNSRLYRPLVFEQKVAKSVSAYQISRGLGSLFVIEATAATGVDVQTLAKALDDAIRAALATPPSQDELDRSLNAWKKSYLHRVESVLDRAHILSGYAHLTGHAGYLAADLARYTEQTPAAVHSAARAWLKPELRARIDVLPQEARPILAPVNRAALPPPGAAPTWAPPKVQAWQLESGLTVWYIQQPQMPLTSLALSFPNGAACDPVGQAGLTRLMVDLLDEGAGARDALGLSEHLQRLATDFSAEAGTDRVHLLMDLLTEQLDPSLAVLADLVQRPHLKEADFQRRLKQIQDQALAAEANPSQGAFLATRRALFGEGYGGYAPTGNQRTLARLTYEDVKAQYTRLIQPQGAVMVIVGDAPIDEMKATLARHFGDWSGAPTAAPLSLSTAPVPVAVQIVDYPDKNQSMILIAKRVTSAGGPSHFEDLLFNHILGGHFSSRLNLNLREDKGYTYGARSHLVRWRQGGMMFLSAQVKTEVTQESVQEMLKELRQIKESAPITDEELQASKDSLTRAFPGDFERRDSVRDRWVTLLEMGLPLSWFDDWRARLEATTREGVQASATQLAAAEGFVIVVAGDAARIKPALRQLGLETQQRDAQGDLLAPTPTTTPTTMPTTTPTTMPTTMPTTRPTQMGR
ncbi:insulinase family protein [Myxococcota bacterium]|nr:insulinase family protein [Myxococcota bacterium]